MMPRSSGLPHHFDSRATSGVGRKQLLMQATPRLHLGLSVRLRPGRPNVPELQGNPLHPFRPQEAHVK